ncbi:MAG: BRO family protein [Candidatus Accumulibacter propinquus]|jgi:DNA-damage-inducible protein D|uniref:BRO family protein n=1 Tax=Candidatus Accumulibacter propinquus TaxID=2954380 RepID=UPI002FC3CBB5
MNTLPVVCAFDGDPPPFELLAQENGFRYWMASDLARALGYPDTEPLHKALNKALAVCMMLNINVLENFTSIEQGRAPEYRLSRFACYLTVMNADPRNVRVAKAQVFFASLAEAFWEAMQQDAEVERLVVRGEISHHEKSLATVAKLSGVVDFARFQNAGYVGMYNMPIWQLKRFKRFEGPGSLLDRMGRDELAANLFRLTQTEAKIRNEGIKGQQPLETAAETVGRIVRNAVMQISGKPPEHLPLSAPIADTKKSIKATQRAFKKLDKNK